jgi:hypothetical protein
MVEYNWSITPKHDTSRTESGSAYITLDWILTGTLNSGSAAISGSDEISFNPADFTSPDYITSDLVKNTIESGLGSEMVAQLKLEIEALLTL